MKVRVILVCTLLLLAALPSSALPLCAHCNEWNECESSPGDYERCFYDQFGNCDTDFKRCSTPFTQSTVLSDWKITSIEISRPAQDSVTVPAPAEVTDVPTSRTIELK